MFRPFSPNLTHNKIFSILINVERIIFNVLFKRVWGQTIIHFFNRPPSTIKNDGLSLYDFIWFEGRFEYNLNVNINTNFINIHQLLKNVYIQ